jgi:hypothetical protein
MKMWKRNFLFIGLCLFGFAVLAGGILQGGRAIEPTGFDPDIFESDDFRRTVDAVNREFQDDWKLAGLDAAPRAPDLTICRRLSLGLTGTVPSLEEIRQIEAQPDEQRVDWWVSRLLADRRYSDYVAERFARVFVGTEDGPFLVYRRRRFVTWLADQLAKAGPDAVPYDEVVRELIANTGLWTDSPAVNFVTVTLDKNNDNAPDLNRLTRRVSRAFLGVRLDCVQCHDDNLGGDWLQADFHGLAAFFSDARMSPTGIRDRRKDYEFQFLGRDEAEVVPPNVPFYPELLDPSGPRRQQLARWVTHPDNKALARTTVNRVWALLFGTSMFETVDNIPLEGPFPPGLQTLADDFVEHGYDLRRLIRLIAATDAFQRDSRADHEITQPHEQHWAAFPLTRLRPEQVAGSLLQASSLTTIDAESNILVRIARAAQQGEFVRRYGDTGEDEFGAHGGTIPQRLLLMNGNVLKEKTKENLVLNASTRIAALAPDDAKAIETAYLSILTRRPTDMESRHFANRLGGAKQTQRNRRMEDVYWTLLNSSEFSWNH